jgi:hypothetical protein
MPPGNTKGSQSCFHSTSDLSRYESNGIHQLKAGALINWPHTTVSEPLQSKILVSDMKYVMHLVLTILLYSACKYQPRIGRNHYGSAISYST